MGVDTIHDREPRHQVAASGRCQGSADVLDVGALAFCRSAHEHNNCIERMSPKVIDSPPARVLGLSAVGDHDRSLHAVTTLRMADVAAGGVLGQHPLRETVEREPVSPTRSARQVRIGRKLQERRGGIGGVIFVMRAKHVGDLVDRSPRDQRIEHNRPDTVCTRFTNVGHRAEVMYREQAQ